MGGVVLGVARRRSVSDEALLRTCSLASGAALIAVAVVADRTIALAGLALVGGATLIQLAILNASAQLILPDAIRGRGLSVYLALSFGCMAFGSLLWGAVADAFSLRGALAAGGAGFLAATALGRIAPIVALPPNAPAETLAS